MTKHILIRSCLGAFLVLSYINTMAASTPVKREFIVHTVDSKYLKEQRKIYVKLPKDFQSSGKKKYAVTDLSQVKNLYL